jgi:protein-S-isoprenylcysteine O-methyltransferase Ste14
MLLFIFLSKFLFPHWKQEPLDEFLDALGIILVLLAFFIRISARGFKAEKSNKGECLIKDGPYSLMRNPMYFGTLLIGLGIVLVLFQWWAFLLFLIVFLLIYIPQIKVEEKVLSKQFGDKYKDYCKGTPKYFPNISVIFKADPRDYLFLKWKWIKKELFSLIAVVGCIIAIEAWEDVKMFGYMEFIKEPLELALIIAVFVIVIILFNKKEEKLQ